MQHARNFVVAGGMLAATSSLSATFVGLGSTSQTFVVAGGMEVDVIRVYATFDSPDDQVVAIGGTPSMPQVLDSGGGGFFQQPIFGLHQNGPTNAGSTEAVVDLAYDSFLTVNIPAGYVGTPTAVTIQDFNLEAFNPAGVAGFGESTVLTNNGGWFVSPAVPESFVKPYPPPNAPPPEGDGPYVCVLGDGPTGNHGVLIGQFTVTAGDTFSGDFGRIAIMEDGVPRILDFTTGTSFLLFGPGQLCADVNGDDHVGFADVLQIIAAWGACEASCAEDLNRNGTVDFADILIVLEFGSWGAPCWTICD